MPIEIAKAKPAASLDSNPGDPAFLKIRDLVYRISGIYHAEEKLYLLSSRCARRMTALGVPSPSEYLEHLTTRGNREAELRLLLNEITIGETYMFRHPAQLEALQNVILPQILQVKGLVSLKRLRFWCAGCSTGEEPHTLAMYLLEEKEKLLAGWTFDILAPDLNDDSLEAARAGSYGEFSAQYQRRAAPEILLKMLATRNFRPTICSKAQIRF